MAASTLKLNAALLDQVQRLGRPLEESVPELIVLELYRRGHITSGKASELLDMERIAFIQYADRLGLPFFELTPDDWKKEVDGLSDL